MIMTVWERIRQKVARRGHCEYSSHDWQCPLPAQSQKISFCVLHSPPNSPKTMLLQSSLLGLYTQACSNGILTLHGMQISCLLKVIGNLNTDILAYDTKFLGGISLGGISRATSVTGIIKIKSSTFGPLIIRKTTFHDIVELQHCIFTSSDVVLMKRGFSVQRDRELLDIKYNILPFLRQLNGIPVKHTYMPEYFRAEPEREADGVKVSAICEGVFSLCENEIHTNCSIELQIESGTYFCENQFFGQTTQIEILPHPQYTPPVVERNRFYFSENQLDGRYASLTVKELRSADIILNEFRNTTTDINIENGKSITKLNGNRVMGSLQLFGDGKNLDIFDNNFAQITSFELRWHKRRGIPICYAETIVKTQEDWHHALRVNTQLIDLAQRVQHSDLASAFRYRKAECRHMATPKGLKRTMWSFWGWVCGYGEIPLNVLRTAIVVVLTGALVFAFAGIEDNDIPLRVTDATNFLDVLEILGSCLYLSIVTFATLGYGDLVPLSGIAKAFASIEAILGALLMALLLYCVGRRT